jgi:hypothetical protein
MFLHNFDALVTKDYLDSRVNEFETRVEARLDKRLAEFSVGIDQRLSQFDKRFTEMETDINRRFAAVELRFERIDGKFNLVYWMQGLTSLCRGLAYSRLSRLKNLRGDFGWAVRRSGPRAPGPR